jgi:DNA-binding response OmpR family regulator
MSVLLENPDIGQETWSPLQSIDPGLLCLEEDEIMRPSQIWQYEFKTADLLVDCSNAIVHKPEFSIDLSRTEVYLMIPFLRCHGQLIKREMLIKMLKMANNNHEVYDNTITVHIGRIRKNLRSMHCGQYIRTRNSLGYVWQPPVYVRKKCTGL